jgi:hypothetical protein
MDRTQGRPYAASCQIALTADKRRTDSRHLRAPKGAHVSLAHVHPPFGAANLHAYFAGMHECICSLLQQSCFFCLSIFKENAAKRELSEKETMI